MVVSPSGATMVVVAVVVLIAAALIDGFRRLAGAACPPARVRQPGQTLREWLLGPVMLKRAAFDLPGKRVLVERSSVAPDSWDAQKPPVLAAGGMSHLWLGERISRYLFPDTLFEPVPVEIDAPASEVWAVLVDFERYGEWNGFHLKKQVVDKPSGEVGLRMTVDLGPVLGKVVETSTVYYVDEDRHILVYGLHGNEAASSVRVVWLEPHVGGVATTLHSYDKVGGWPAWFCYGHINRHVLQGFNEQHLAIRDRVVALRRRVEALAPPPLSTCPDELGACLVTGGHGFMGGHLVRMLASLRGVTQVHVIDLAQPPAGVPPNVTFSRCSVTDVEEMRAIFAQLQPTTIFHAASLIDLRPGVASATATEEVNVQATQHLLELARQHGARRFVYTSSIEVVYRDNRCLGASEMTPYSPHPGNPYQRTKIAAERAVLRACTDSLATLAVRPAHIYGSLHEDEIGRFIQNVSVCFGEMTLCGGHAGAAPMSMVHVENVALAHVLAAVQATRHDVRGRAFHVRDFDENIVCWYRALAGKGPPAVCLPAWLLAVFVHIAMVLHILCLAVGSYQVLGAKTGLHHGAMAAAKPCTISSREARSVLGYSCYGCHVTRELAIESCRKVELGPPLPLIDAKMVAEAIACACNRPK